MTKKTFFIAAILFALSAVLLSGIVGNSQTELAGIILGSLGRDGNVAPTDSPEPISIAGFATIPLRS